MGKNKPLATKNNGCEDGGGGFCFRNISGEGVRCAAGGSV